MSYAQAMRWHKKHPRGGKPQYMGFSAGSGFWPSISWTNNDWIPYLKECEKLKTQPFQEQTLYNAKLRGHILAGQSPEICAAYTKARRDIGKTSHLD